MRRSLTILLIALLASASLLACGKLDKDEYATQVNEAGAELGATFTRLGREVRSARDAKAMSAVLRRGSASLRGSASRLDELSAPDDAEAATERLVGGLETMADDFDDAAATADRGQLPQLVTKIRSIATSRGAQTVQGAINDLKAKGYAIKDN